MNMNQVINMIIRTVMRRLVNSGINAGIDAVASRGQRKSRSHQEMDSELGIKSTPHQQQPSAERLAKREMRQARRAARAAQQSTRM